MQKKKHPTNQELLHHKQWWSKTFGWVILAEANDGYVQAVYEYWFFTQRPHVVEKIKRVNIHLQKQYDEQIEEKNKRRADVISMNDAMVNQEYIKRMLNK